MFCIQSFRFFRFFFSSLLLSFFYFNFFFKQSFLLFVQEPSPWGYFGFLTCAQMLNLRPCCLRLQWLRQPCWDPGRSCFPSEFPGWLLTKQALKICSWHCAPIQHLSNLRGVVEISHYFCVSWSGVHWVCGANLPAPIQASPVVRC